MLYLQYSYSLMTPQLFSLLLLLEFWGDFQYLFNKLASFLIPSTSLSLLAFGPQKLIFLPFSEYIQQVDCQ